MDDDDDDYDDDDDDAPFTIAALATTMPLLEVRNRRRTCKCKLMTIVNEKKNFFLLNFMTFFFMQNTLKVVFKILFVIANICSKT